MASGRVTGYGGVTAPAGLEEEAFAVGELLVLAAEAVGGQRHLADVHLPVSLVMNDADRAGPSFTAGARFRPTVGAWR